MPPSPRAEGSQRRAPAVGGGVAGAMLGWQAQRPPPLPYSRRSPTPLRVLVAPTTTPTRSGAGADVSAPQPRERARAIRRRSLPAGKPAFAECSPQHPCRSSPEGPEDRAIVVGRHPLRSSRHDLPRRPSGRVVGPYGSFGHPGRPCASSFAASSSACRKTRYHCPFSRR